MSGGVVVSREVPAPRGVVSAWLVPVHRAGSRAPRAPLVRLRLGGTVMDLDVVDAVDGVAGTAYWAGIPHRVTVHLVDQGGSATLVVATAEPQDPAGGGHPLHGGGRSALAHRHALRDLRHLADALLAHAATWGATPSVTAT